jgi:acyl-CoA thioesterase I
MKKIALLWSFIMILNLHAAPVRILPLGDSITQGGRNDRKEYTYRWPLFCKLVDEKIDFDFIGSRNFGLNSDAKWPKEYKGKFFDMDHEGYYGIKTASALNELKKAKKRWPAAPDIVLIHLGTNDQNAKDYQKAVSAPLQEMIKLLRIENPKVVIILGHLNFNGGKAKKIYPLVEQLAEKMNTKTSPVITVHHYKGWKENPKDANSDTFDWAHPNPQGQKKMADNWYNAMKPYLKKYKKK